MEKVSVISPVYNGEKYITRFLESIINQTYKNIELIIIDDGSIDSTREIVFKFKKRLKDCGIDFYYIYQENMGAAYALNKGFKLMSGDYFTWPDTDDYLETNSIELRVKYLKEYNLKMVRSDANLRKDETIEHIHRRLNYKNEMKEIINIFDDLIIEKIPVCNGTFLIDTKYFCEKFPGKNIYESNAGQNWQIILPLSYKQKCGYLDIPLYNYIIRENSHSRREKSTEEIKQKYLNHQDILLNTMEYVSFSDNEEKQYYLELIKEKYKVKLKKLEVKEG
ncbi:MAG: glycosyltransferase family 2 protein [Psychrobacillus psychrodurans]